jgi:hypothetical protein
MGYLLDVLEEAGVAPASYPTVNRRPLAYARDSWRAKLSVAYAAHARLGIAATRSSTTSTGTTAPAGTTHTVNRALEAKAGSLAGLKGYITNLAACPTTPPSPGLRVRRPGPQPLDRSTDGMVHPEVRPHRPPLPRHRNPGATCRKP